MWKQLRVALAGYRLFRDPERLDEVLVAANLLSSSRKDDRAMYDAIRDSSPYAAALFRTGDIRRYDLAVLERYAPGTLGRTVYDHCKRNAIDPATFPVRNGTEPVDLLTAHLESTHDVWHALTGFTTDPVGEIGLQAFYLAQFSSPLAQLLLTLAHAHVLTKSPGDSPALMDSIARGWLLGKRAQPLFGLPWHEMWDRPLDEVRRELCVDLASVDEVVSHGAPHFRDRLGLQGAVMKLALRAA